MSDNIVTATDATFESEVLQSEGVVLVDFWATWCGPCKRVAPVVDKLADDYAGEVKVVKVDIDASPETTDMFGIQGVPTFIAFKDGQPVISATGAHPRGTFDQLIAQARDAQA